jgi:hypothetical protein
MYSIESQPTYRMNLSRQSSVSKNIPIKHPSWLSFLAGFCLQVGSQIFFLNVDSLSVDERPYTTIDFITRTVITSNIIINPIILFLNLWDRISSWCAYSHLVMKFLSKTAFPLTNPVTALYPGPGELFHNLTPFSFILMLSYRLHLDFSKWSPSFIFSDKMVHMCLISPIRNPPHLHWWILRSFSDHRAQYGIRHLKDLICKSMCTTKQEILCSLCIVPMSSGCCKWLVQTYRHLDHLSVSRNWRHWLCYLAIPSPHRAHTLDW